MGVGGLLFTLVRTGFATNPGEGMNFKIFTITPVMDLNLAQKQILFIKEYKNLAVVKYSEITQIYDYLLSKLTIKDFDKYNIILEKITTTLEIKNYASEIIQDYVTSYNASLGITNSEKLIQFSAWLDKMKPLFKIFGIVVVVIAVFVLITLIFGISTLEILNIQKQHLSLTQETISKQSECFELLQNLGLDVKTLNKVQDVITRLFANMHLREDAMQQRISNLESGLSLLLEKLKSKP